MKNLLLSDYDCTFFTDEESIKINCDAIMRYREKGNCFSIVTGRGFNSIKEEVEKHQIPYDYLSCVDGATLFDKEDNMIKKYLLNERKCLDLKDRLDKITDLELNLYYELQEITDNNIIQCYYRLENYDKIELLHNIVKKEIRSLNLHSEVLDFKYCQLLVINSGKTSKKRAGKDIAEIEKISYNNIYAIGDQCNDIPMLKAYNGFTVSNAIENVKDVSICVYDSVAKLADDIVDGKAKQKVKQI